MGESGLKEIKLWGLFHGCSHGLYTARRVSNDGVVFPIGDSTYHIDLSDKADAHTALIGFDGFFLRHGLAGGTKVLKYEFTKKNTAVPIRGGECIEVGTGRAHARHISEYEDETGMREPDDYYQVLSDTAKDKVYAHPARSQRHFIAVPITREGSRSLVCQLKPRSLQRRYVMLVATREEVQFITCNSY